MFKPIPVAIGLGYLRAKRRNGFISFISLASILGIALGVAALITTLAVVSGFQREIRDRLLQMAAHATVSAYGEPIAEWQLAVDQAVADKRVAGAAPYVEKEALLAGARQHAALVRGVVPDRARRWRGAPRAPAPRRCAGRTRSATGPATTTTCAAH